MTRRATFRNPLRERQKPLEGGSLEQSRMHRGGLLFPEVNVTFAVVDVLYAAVRRASDAPVPRAKALRTLLRSAAAAALTSEGPPR